MLSIIKPRGDIKSNWDSANPVLRMREWGVEWDTTVGVGDVKIKIGDGVTPWSTLDYVIVSDVTKKIVKTFAEVTAENPELTENSAMDVLWATAKKKFEYLNTKVTDISENGDIDLTKVNIPTFTEYTESTLPDARTAITNITAGIKMPAFISNAKAALKGLVTLGEMRSLLVNSGLTTETGKYFLDAAYGKTLADQISQLNSTRLVKLLSTSNLNEIKNDGKYCQTTSVTATTERNYPEMKAGLLEVSFYSDDWIFQRYTTYDIGNTYARTFHNAHWQNWYKINVQN